MYVGHRHFVSIIKTLQKKKNEIWKMVWGRWGGWPRYIDDVTLPTFRQAISKIGNEEKNYRKKRTFRNNRSLMFRKIFFFLNGRGEINWRRTTLFVANWGISRKKNPFLSHYIFFYFFFSVYTRVRLVKRKIQKRKMWVYRRRVRVNRVSPLKSNRRHTHRASTSFLQRAVCFFLARHLKRDTER